MATNDMSREEAIHWVEEAISYRNAALVGTFTVDQLKEGAELATAKAAAAADSVEAARYAKRARNNVMLVLALDELGCDTCNEAIMQIAAEAAETLGAIRA